MAIDWDQVQADWITAGKPLHVPRIKGDWEPLLLHVTDLNKCPRQVALRLQGEQQVNFPQEIITMDAGTERHWAIFSALMWGGFDPIYEVAVEGLPEGWSGSIDLLLKLPVNEVIFDFKTQRAQAFKLEASRSQWPKPEWVEQLDTYRIFTPRAVASANVVMDRDGSNQTQTIWTPSLTPERAQVIREKMIFLEDVRTRALNANGPTIPHMLPVTVRWEDVRDTRKGWSGDLIYGPSWKCSYCGMESCPQHRAHKRVLATRRATKGLVLTAEGRRQVEAIEDFLEEGARDLERAI
jgi:hypothetical protein